MVCMLFWLLVQYSLDGRTWLDEIRWMAATAAALALYDWSHVLPHQIAGKLLVMWKVWWWPHWSALPFLETVQHDDQDDQSFAQYSLPPNPDLKGPYWDRAVWDPFSAGLRPIVPTLSSTSGRWLGLLPVFQVSTAWLSVFV